MLTGLLALLLLAATIDPRLVGPLQLLAELHAARPEIADYSRTPDVLHLTVRVAPLPPLAGGHYAPRTQTLTMAEALLAEDPRVLAAGLADQQSRSTTCRPAGRHTSCGTDRPARAAATRSG